MEIVRLQDNNEILFESILKGVSTRVPAGHTSIVLGALEDSAVRGVLVADYNDSLLIINAVFVEGEYQHRGYATTLLRELITSHQGKKVEEIMVIYRRDLDSVLIMDRLFVKAGFLPTLTYGRYYHVGVYEFEYLPGYKKFSAIEPKEAVVSLRDASAKLKEEFTRLDAADPDNESLPEGIINNFDPDLSFFYYDNNKIYGALLINRRENSVEIEQIRNFSKNNGIIFDLGAALVRKLYDRLMNGEEDPELVLGAYVYDDRIRIFLDMLMGAEKFDQLTMTKCIYTY